MKESEIIEALKRSGYLFESSISEYLGSNDYFVENNSVIIDPQTGKNREIDIIAHKNDIYKDYENKISSLVTFVFELKNNLFPIVLLTKFQFNPDTPEDLLKEYVSVPENSKYESFESFYIPLILDVKTIYTQYCSFQRKNNKTEIMALHPDDLYQGICKIIQYCEDSAPWWFSDINENIPPEKDQWFRHDLHMPVILLKNDLYELELVNNEPNLFKVDFSQIIFKYHIDNKQKSNLVHFVTEKGLGEWLRNISKLEQKTEIKLLRLKRK